jgi:ribose/xylose/arabinose/galactoside ABC-type transport system permease subunit
MKMLVITWTDIFYAIGDFFQWIFRGMKVLGHIPNVLIWLLIIGILAYWTMRLSRYRKEAQRNNTIE